MFDRVSFAAGTRFIAPTGLSIHKDDALVALSDIGQIVLNDERFTEHSLEKLYQATRYSYRLASP